jgi:PPOX class probable F420-dependent enzyme
VTGEEARRGFAEARVARLATVSAAGRPHAVPLCFVLEGDAIYWAVDEKPKRTRELRRLRNIAENARVCVLVDGYDEDWSRLWWVRADGEARLLDASEEERALGLLAEKYPQYREAVPYGPAVVVDVDGWRWWSAR